MNEKQIKALTWVKDKRITLGDGLYLNIRKSSKTYIIRKMVNVRVTVTTLGKSPALSLKLARLKALQLSTVVDVSNTTVSELVKKYWTEVVEPSSKVPKQVSGYLDQIEDRFGNKKVMDIRRADLVAFIQLYAKRGARSADRMRSYLKQVFSYGVELGYIDTSPMTDVTKRVTGYRPIDRTRVLNSDEIRMVWEWKNPKTGWQKTEENSRLIKFLLLTGLRISEAQHGYIDGDKFRISDTKGKHGKHETRPHWVCLTDTAKAQLPLPVSSATNIQAFLKRKLVSEGIEDRFTPHDCRRTFATLANDNGVEPFIVERVLNHRMAGVMSVYNHAEYEDARIDCAEKVEKIILKILS